MERQEALARMNKAKNRRGARYQVSPKERRTIDGITFASLWEKDVYAILKRRVPAEHLHLQPRFELQEGFRSPDGKWVLPIRYDADFLLGPGPRESDAEPVLPRQVVIDAKGDETEIFRIKQKLFKRRYGYCVRLAKRAADVEALIDEYLSLIKVPRPKGTGI